MISKKNFCKKKNILYFLIFCYVFSYIKFDDRIKPTMKSYDMDLEKMKLHKIIKQRFEKRNEHLKEICKNRKLHHKQKIKTTLKSLLFSKNKSFISCVVAKVSNLSVVL